MNFFSCKVLAPAVALGLGLGLSGCGGGDDDPLEPGDLEPTTRAASVVVSNASNPALNGTYSTTGISLTQVVKENLIGSSPEQCKFRFAGLQGPNGVLMDGDIRYRPGTSSLETMFASIAGIQFSSPGGANTAVDSNNNEIDLTGKVFNPGTQSTITVTGSIPMRLGRPEGC